MMVKPWGGGGGRSGGRNTSTLRPPEQISKCPRCDSSNTKFCYYNNYSLAQPRHFYKACKRYWTKGGALRNVPIGGSCKKNKKTKSCSSRFFPGESCSKFSSYDIAGMKVLGPSTLDFQLIGGLNILPRVTSPNQFTSSNQYSLVNLDPLGYNLPFSSSHINVMKQEHDPHHHHHHHQQQQHNQNGGEFGSFHEMGTTTSNHLILMRNIRDKELKRSVKSGNTQLDVELTSVVDGFNGGIFNLKFTREGSSYMLKNFGQVITHLNLVAGEIIEFTPTQIGESLRIQFNVTR
ncbi:hypothetical protein QVD17_39937 [Tagetes erecta]|uniref:Dof zinc finger protein n=1 Tax=Tagetes erecta TaxID=13708 RepID=A0AAD8NFT2_TARER|nr:hypothetical protein QVD17_39937 [Tagetes erecta]